MTKKQCNNGSGSIRNFYEKLPDRMGGWVGEEETTNICGMHQWHANGRKRKNRSEAESSRADQIQVDEEDDDVLMVTIVPPMTGR
ncbi:unnamed protein product [Litomosoides sigmodontis]|uniref:Uncharacterized protein n=1 Tax=Litomosoides sigmodontis TaxID=42156 RepID=A0A3P6TR76_LITSI|nr:unnamed protein product [Litomosoides sigmodontis]